MPRVSYYRMGALNIVLHPHAPEIYVELFRDLAGANEYVRVHGDTALLLRPYLVPFDGSNLVNGFSGVFYKFFDLDKNADWGDILNASIASNAERDKIRIPDHLKPHLQVIEFVFYPQHHILFFESKGKQRKELKRGDTSLSARSLTKYFEAFFNNETFIEKCEHLRVQPIPTDGTVERMFRIPQIKTIEFVIHRPNPDEQGQSFEERFLNKMRRRNAHKEERKYSGQGITPDEDIINLAGVAKNNGEVKVTGKDENNMPFAKSSTETPFNEPYPVSEDEIAIDRLKEVSRMWLQRILATFRSINPNEQNE